MIGPGEATRQGSTKGKEAGNGIPGAPRGSHTSSSLLVLLATPPSEPPFPGSAERLMAYAESGGGGGVQTAGV